MRNQSEAGTRDHGTSKTDSHTPSLAEASSELLSLPNDAGPRGGLEPHPWAFDFDPAPEKSLTAVKSILGTSRVSPEIFTFQGKVVHPWPLYVACLELGIEPHIIEIDVDDPIGHLAVAVLHGKVRHDWHRALLVVRLCGCRGRGRPRKQDDMSYFSHKGKPQRTEAQMAELADVNVKTIQRAKLVRRHGLDDMVLEGVMTFTRAEEQCRQKAGCRTSFRRSAASSGTTDGSVPVANETSPADLEQRIDQLERELRQANAEIAAAAHRVERAREDSARAERARSEEERRADGAEARVLYLERTLRAAKVPFDDPGPRQPRLAG